ncbi:phenylalanyl-tRNA synthetase subunit beta [Tateyamaria sp. SN6-1]|uniref:phenylalanyl-tRNA synthetase subunit beta n=1 Tax=Tateyamaria sp. SN6-1 TaxID=3092148 RepID=UPI0039F61C7C
MRLALVLALVTLIVIAHVFLWRSEMVFGLKLTFTILNAIGWAIVLLPILFIDKWLDAIKRRNSETDNHDNVT